PGAPPTRRPGSSARAPPLLHRRARLRAAPSARVPAHALRPAARGRRAARPCGLRLPRPRVAPAREGVPPLGRRHVGRLHAARARSGRHRAHRRPRRRAAASARRAAAPLRSGEPQAALVKTSVDPYALARWDLVTGRTALVLIDDQRDFLHPEGWYAKSGIDI